MSTVHGLPVHVLLVHAVVVLVPLCGLILALSSVWPAARRRLAAPNALLGLFTLVLVPVTTSAGEWLQGHVDSGALVRHHAELGDTAIWFTVPVAALAVLMWWRNREIAAADGHLPPPGPLSRILAHDRPLLAPRSSAVAAVIASACIVTAGAAAYDIYRIGDSGAKAAWHDGFDASSDH